MNGNLQQAQNKPLEEANHNDLLPHKYRPNSTDSFKCHADEARRLKTWIQEFIKQSNRSQLDQQNHSDYDDDDDSYGSNFSSAPRGTQIVSPRCLLLTGPPGVGKTSLVYTVANELKLHVIESHSSERRDAKLFNMLKLTNQKTKINTIAKLFQVARMQQPQQQSIPSQARPETRRNKRRKLSETSSSSLNTPQQPIVVIDVEEKPKSLSISGDTSIVLFDDIDVIFDEDGPFLKSLVEFIRETKRPVVLTATKSIDYIKTTLVYFEQIHLQRPILNDCANLLREICKQEKFKHLGKQLSRCQSIADNYNCDIRKSLNGIHFYGDKLDEILQTQSSYYNELNSNFTQLNLEKETETEIDCNKDLLNCYASQSIIDIIDTKFNLVNESTLLELWLNGLPSIRNEEHNFYQQDLGEQIKESIVELTKKLYSNQLMSHQNVIEIKDSNLEIRQRSYDAADNINRKINSRIEPPDREFYNDIVPQLGQIINLEAKSRQVDSVAKGIFTSRRSRRTISYLDSINVYLDPEEINSIAEHHIYKSSCEES